MMKRVAWVMALSVVLGSQPAWAARTKVHEMAESQQYGRKLGGMLGRGLLNVVTSPVDLLVNTVNETKTGPPFVGTLTGLGRGLGCGTLRLGSGVVDVVTCWVPGFNGFPVSDSYENCFAPMAQSASMEPAPMGPSQPASSWEVPTAEPGAAQVPPAEQPAKPHKTWKK